MNKEKIKLGIPIEDEATRETNVILRTNEIRIVEEAFEEIERLNNIINELEKDMNRDDLSYVETQYVLNKIKELKGVDKE